MVAVKGERPGEHVKDILTLRKRAILERWYEQILALYPPETARFFREEKDRFANPVGTTIYQGLEGLYEELLKGINGGEINRERAGGHLDNIIRIRAIQDFSPSQALAFIFQLKRVIRQELAGTLQEKSLSLQELEDRLDNLALLAFDIYMQCREQLYDLRVKEFKNRTARLLQRANLSVNFPY